ncbi:hypothetical protein niasHS_001217 [Heterodera schachtii]|uniref:DUF7083 domain-containing protein n=1 Tax=Heterodera schachtii TaxID=97005 RepID=A0ABD2KIK4_HETSC
MSITSEQLKAILADQQSQFMKLLQNIQIGNAPPQQNPSQSNDMDLFCKLSAQISEFVYSPDDNRTFEEWYERFGPFVEQEGKPMSEQSKVRLIVSKLGTDEYKRYTESIQPKTPEKVGLLDTISKLRTIFPETKSIFIKRYECFQLTCEVNQDVLAFGSTVNAMAEKAKLDLTKDQIKSLIFITGLGEHNAELRYRCIKLLDGNANYEQLLADCKEVIALRQSSAALSGRHDFNSIQIRPSNTTLTQPIKVQSNIHQNQCHPSHVTAVEEIIGTLTARIQNQSNVTSVDLRRNQTSLCPSNVQHAQEEATHTNPKFNITRNTEQIGLFLKLVIKYTHKIITRHAKTVKLSTTTGPLQQFIHQSDHQQDTSKTHHQSITECNHKNGLIR